MSVFKNSVLIGSLLLWIAPVVLVVRLYAVYQRYNAEESAFSGAKKESRKLRDELSSVSELASSIRSERRGASSKKDNTEDKFRDDLLKTLRECSETVTDLKIASQSLPELNIPEMALLSEQEWMAIALEDEVTSASHIRVALADLRNAARVKFGESVGAELKSYIASNAGRWPEDISKLFNRPGSTSMKNILSSYHIVNSSNKLWIEPKSMKAVDPLDQFYKINETGFFLIERK